MLEEGEEVNEHIFVVSGNYSIGFQERDTKFFHIKLSKKTIIGGYENLFDYESEFFYKSIDFLEGFGLRKSKLKPLMEKFPDFERQVRLYFVNFYYKIIREPMLLFKQQIKNEVGQR